MRMVVTWDGSGHALEALRNVVGLFREQSVEHIEIVLAIWPPRDIAMWSDIQQQQILSDDLHRAAAEVGADEVQRLEEILRPITRAISSSTANGHISDIVVATIARTHADFLFVLAGTHDASGVIQETMRSIVAQSKIPTLILRPAGNSTP